MTVVSNRSSRRERFLLIIFVVSVVPLISPQPIHEQLLKRMPATVAKKLGNPRSLF
jgi:hypothetical protein